jgi:hypothetical protein
MDGGSFRDSPFLGTTFALGDDDVRAELERFVADPDSGVSGE